MAGGADDVIAFYRRHGLAWSRDRNRGGFEQGWIDRFLAVLPRSSGASPKPTVLDLGCGSGEPIGRYLVQQGLMVVGIDTAPALVERCLAIGSADECIVADMRTLALDRRFDGILAWNSFFHLDHDEQRAMFAVFRNHSGPGAALMFTSGPAHGTANGLLHGEPLFHASLAPAEYRTLLDTHGYDTMAHGAEDPACFGHTVWLARLR